MKRMRIQALIFLLGFTISFSGAWALADYRPDDRGHTDQHQVVADRQHPHYYHNGRWYRHGWFGFGIAVPTLAAGVYVNSLPTSYTPVVVQGSTYYYGDNTYFAPSPQGGYVVVSAPTQ